MDTVRKAQMKDRVGEPDCVGAGRMHRYKMGDNSGVYNYILCSLTDIASPFDSL